MLKDKFFEEALPHERYHKEMDFLNKRDLDTLKQAYNQLISKDYTFEEARKIGISEQEILDQKNFQELLLKEWRKSGIPEDEIQKEIDRKFDKIELVKDKSGMNFRRVSALQNWHEFYPYLSQGEYRQQVESVFKKIYPEAHKIFIDIKKRTQLSNSSIIR